MCSLRVLCLVSLLIFFSTVSQAEESSNSVSLPVASEATLTRFKEKLTENAGRDAMIQCELKEVNKIFLVQKWGESTFEFTDSNELTISTIPPEREEFLARFRKAQLDEKSNTRLAEKYKIKKLSEHQFQIPIPEKRTLQTGSEVSKQDEFCLFDLVFGIGSGIMLKFDLNFESFMLVNKSSFLLNSYEQTEELCSSCTLYQSKDDLIWQLIPRNKNNGEEFLILIDKQTLVPKDLKITHPGKTSYEELAVIKYEIK